MAAIDSDGCIQFSPRSKTCPSWPVRIVGMQGVWRYLNPMTPADMEVSSVTHVEVIGPFFPNSPERNGGRSRIFSIDKLKYAGKSAKPIDVQNVEATALSNEAKRARRR
jgi:hypothetical protein